MNKKLIGILTVVLLSVSSIAQTSNTAAEGFTVHLSGVIDEAVNGKIVILSQNINQGRVPVATILTDENGAYSSDFKVPFSDFYVFRLENGQALNLVLRPKSSIVLNGRFDNLLNDSEIKGSEESNQMKSFYQNYVPYKNFEDSLKNVLKLDPSKQADVNKAFQVKAIPFISYRNGYIKSNVNSPAILAALSNVDQEKEFALFKQIVTQLNTSFPESPTSKMLVGHVKKLTTQKKVNEKIGPGKPAPEIIMTGVDGKELKLSDLKGKVVLIDMWASWCGPCRRENPNVVKAYNKYNKDGFEVFSVSFDKPGMKARWLAAIQQDGLVWPYHGSELNGFNNQAARDYSVRGIPFTCLVDAEGNIVKTNLRGAALELELKRIFGH
jgi:thiol-disulfide isomerase/thioredoxin